MLLHQLITLVSFIFKRRRFFKLLKGELKKLDNSFYNLMSTCIAIVERNLVPFNKDIMGTKSDYISANRYFLNEQNLKRLNKLPKQEFLRFLGYRRFNQYVNLLDEYTYIIQHVNKVAINRIAKSVDHYNEVFDEEEREKIELEIRRHILSHIKYIFHSLHGARRMKMYRTNKSLRYIKNKVNNL